MKEKLYMVGIGGIGMSALAQMLLSLGYEVSGSDREESPTTSLLKQKGIEVFLTQDGSHVPADASRIIYSEAVWEDNKERMRAKELGIPQESYFEALGRVAKGKRTIAVSGTHGKTTTTAMLALILRDAGYAPHAIVGSIVRGFPGGTQGSNYLQGTSDILVVEACEYKRDFLTLFPEVLVITNIELDHTDYYQDLADIEDAFRTLVQQTTGSVVADVTSETVQKVVQGADKKILDYTREGEYELSVPGAFNQMNAKAAAQAARALFPGISEEAVRASLKNFSGTWRRFDYRGKTKQGADVYDDYAHHPTAIQKTLREVRARASGKVYVAFHPHLYSRTRDLLDGFSKAFSDADEVLIAPIYPAREVDDGSVSNELLAERIRANGINACALDFQHIESFCKEVPAEGDVVVTMGAGDIYKVADALVV